MKMKLIRGILLLLAVSTATPMYLFAQISFSLRNCIDYARSNNSKVKLAGYNVEMSNKKLSEQAGTYLPQLNTTGTFDDNLQLTTQLMPAEMTGGTPGTYIAVKFGNKYSMNLGIQLTQKIFDASAFQQIKSANLNKKISEQSRELTGLDVVYNISLSFYQSLVVQMQAEVLKSTLLVSEKSLKSIELKFKNGMAKQIDVDRIKVSYNNAKSQLEQMIQSYAQSLNTLKYNIGIPVDSAIVLADTMISEEYNSFINAASGTFQLDNVIDYSLQKSNVSSAKIDKKAKQSAFLPVLSFYGNYNSNAMRQEFTFFDSGKEWYSSSGIGLKLTVPLFDGLQRNSRLAQSELNIKIAEENLKLLGQSIKVDVSNYEIQYGNALDNIVREKENLDLAKSVYASSQQEYQQGTCSTLELIQSQSSYLVAQSYYYDRLLKLYLARIDLEKSKGTLMSFINTLK
jgi:outer membrane protein TolC